MRKPPSLMSTLRLRRIRRLMRSWRGRSPILAASALLWLAACSGERMAANDCPEEPAPQGMVAGVSPPEDDGFNTYLRFPGRMRIPQITAKDEHGRERAVDRTTNPDTGEVILHGVFPVIVLRTGQHTACFVNRAWNPIGRRPLP